MSIIFDTIGTYVLVSVVGLSLMFLGWFANRFIPISVRFVLARLRHQCIQTGYRTMILTSINDFFDPADRRAQDGR